MPWNGNFAALLFVNRWEYTRHVTWAKEAAYPLLDGLNAWWGAYLVKGADGVYVDFRAADPDEQHEGQRDPNPQIGLALIKRTMLAQLDMAEAMGVAPPPRLQDVLDHFPDWNTASTAVTPAPAPAPAPRLDTGFISGEKQRPGTDGAPQPNATREYKVEPNATTATSVRASRAGILVPLRRTRTGCWLQ